MITFYLPDFYYQYNLNTKFIKYFNEHKSLFQDNIQIGGIYGTFPSAIWNGGRLDIEPTATMKNIKATIKSINDLNIPIRYTWTNCLLTKQDCFDNYCNYIMDQSLNYQNEIIINSPILEEYLRNKYPNFKYISSTTKCLTNIKQIQKELNKNYYLVVLDYNLNKNINFLQSISNPNKVELLINEFCSPNCPNRNDHYKYMSQIMLRKEENINNDLKFFTCKTYEKNFYEILNNKNTIKVDELYNKYVPMGFTHFKLVGRTGSMYDILESYIYYMVKPEFQNQVRLEILLSL